MSKRSDAHHESHSIPKLVAKTTHSDTLSRDTSASTAPDEVLIRDVWTDNFEEETYNIMRFIHKYNYVALDLEFPGAPYESRADTPYYYTIKRNVDELKIIQVGLSFTDEHGNPPPGTSTWQFNLHFDRSKDLHAKDSIEMLERAGIEFDKHQTQGIDTLEFAAWLTGSNLCFNDDIKWICWTGCYDFAYMLKLMSNTPLPRNETEFYQSLKTYFPIIYDVKHIIRDIEQIKQGSLSKLANDLDIKRIGSKHQGGSDSLVTIVAFFKIKEMFLRNHIDDYKYVNIIYGLNGELESQQNDYSQPQSMSLFTDPAFYQDLAASYMSSMGFMNYTTMPTMVPQVRYMPATMGMGKPQETTAAYHPMMYSGYAGFP